jgi:hypothetical protein
MTDPVVCGVIPDLEFRRPDGTAVLLSELQGDAAALVVIFLRHLA